MAQPTPFSGRRKRSTHSQNKTTELLFVNSLEDDPLFEPAALGPFLSTSALEFGSVDVSMCEYRVDDLENVC